MVAYFLYKKVPGHKVFRFAFYLPCLIAPVITTAIFMALIKVGGPIYKLVGMFGIEYQELLAYPETATKTIVAYVLSLLNDSPQGRGDAPPLHRAEVYRH